MGQVVNVFDIFNSINQILEPSLVAQVNNHKVQAVRSKGELVWHRHDDTDEAFLILRGRVTLELRDQKVELGEGDMYVVPRGVEHRPVPHGEARVILIEKADTPYIGPKVPASAKSAACERDVALTGG